MTASEHLDRAFEIQMEANRRLEANPVFRVVFVVGALAGMVLFDLWFLSQASLGGGIDWFVLTCVAVPWVALALSTAVWLRRRRQ
ncbi:MAG: hypothetical protein U0838_04735 [Chloroflexota bacterium]